MSKVMACKHPIKSLHVTSHHDSTPDGYGGDNEWTWHELTCKKCKASNKVSDNDRFDKMRESDYTDFTKRELTLKEAQRLFIENNTLYNQITKESSLNDQVLRTRGKRSDQLFKKMKAKKKLIEKHTKELDSMLRDYHGREPYYHEKAYL